jgi:hypothetical protein
MVSVGNIDHTRPPLSLKSEVLEKCAEKVESHQIADLHEHSSGTGAAWYGQCG